jgi:hypothetical protein
MLEVHNQLSGLVGGLQDIKENSLSGASRIVFFTLPTPIACPAPPEAPKDGKKVHKNFAESGGISFK